MNRTGLFTTRYITPFNSSIAISCTLIGASTLAYWLWLGDKSVATETGILERGQVVFLSLACFFALKLRKLDSGEKLTQYLRNGLAVFCSALLLREVDIDQLGTSAYWGSVETLLRALILLALLLYLGFMLSKIPLLRMHTKRILRMPMIGLSLLACIFYVASWPFDKWLWDLSRDLSTLIEETLELNASILFLVASCAQKIDYPETENNPQPSIYSGS